MNVYVVVSTSLKTGEFVDIKEAFYSEKDADDFVEKLNKDPNRAVYYHSISFNVIAPKKLKNAADEYVKSKILEHNSNLVLRPKSIQTFADELSQAFIDGAMYNTSLEEPEKVYDKYDVNLKNEPVLGYYKKPKTYKEMEKAWHDVIESRKQED